MLSVGSESLSMPGSAAGTSSSKRIVRAVEGGGVLLLLHISKIYNWTEFCDGYWGM